MKKRFLALLTASILIIGISSCVKPDIPEKKSEPGALFDGQVTIKVATGSHPSWPYDENWKAWQYFREDGAIQVQAIPNSEYPTKRPCSYRKGYDSDLMYIDSKIRGYPCSSGALIAIDDYPDKLPNFTEFWNSILRRKKGYDEPAPSGDGKYISRRITDFIPWGIRAHGFIARMSSKSIT